MACSPLDQAPRSINLHRSEQNGRVGFLLDHAVGFLQVGQVRIRALGLFFCVSDRLMSVISIMKFPPI